MFTRQKPFVRVRLLPDFGGWPAKRARSPNPDRAISRCAPGLSSFRVGGTAFFNVVTDHHAAHRSGSSKLVFYRYDSEYVLHTIEESPARTEATVPETKRQKQLERSHSQPQIAMIEALPK